MVFRVDVSVRHKKIFKLIYQLMKWPVCAVFGYTYEPDHLDEPTLVVSNHVTDVDFLFVAIGLQGSHTYFVASDHIFRLGWLSKAINWLVAPIARRKGTTAMDTAMTMMRKLRAGHSVCVFGEGESTWNGRSIPIYPATATLARVSGKPLKTFRIEGGHLSMPRWGKGIRRGKMYGHVVNTYTPERLKAMTPDEINEAINRDIYEDAWERQKKNPVRYRGRSRAEAIETVLFICPKCKRIGTVRGKGHKVYCDCGFTTSVTEYGMFEPAQPFENIAQWDQWQMECLKNGGYAPEAKMLDEKMVLYRFSEDGQKEKLGQGTLRLEQNVIWFEDRAFDLAQITNLALIQKKMIVLTYADHYYEIRAAKPLCLRKYLAAWHNYQNASAKGA